MGTALVGIAMTIPNSSDSANIIRATQNLTGSEGIPKKFGLPRSSEKNFLGLLGVRGGMLPQNILKI